MHTSREIDSGRPEDPLRSPSAYHAHTARFLCAQKQTRAARPIRTVVSPSLRVSDWSPAGDTLALQASLVSVTGCGPRPVGSRCDGGLPRELPPTSEKTLGREGAFATSRGVQGSDTTPPPPVRIMAHSHASRSRHIFARSPGRLPISVQVRCIDAPFSARPCCNGFTFAPFESAQRLLLF